MRESKIRLDYDSEADVLYIAFDAFRPGYGDMIDDVVIVRRDFNTHEILSLIHI